MKRQLLLFFFIAFVYQSSLFAQRGDTAVVKETVVAKDTVVVKDETLLKHSPKKATYFSLVLPGLGQAYNKKYWKIPLVYAIIGVPLVLGLDQQSQFKEFRDALGSRLDDDPATIDNKYDGVYTDQNMRSLIDFHRKNRDLFLILSVVGYAINVVDATVDAHLFYFDVSDDLSATFKPSVQVFGPQQTLVPSFNLSLKFTKKQPRLINY
tara:strand:+ start:750 stop:1376 length:627 start_codon:yes stop_codon:yes gene_type:complete